MSHTGVTAGSGSKTLYLLQAASVPSVDNKFLEPFGVPDIVKMVMQNESIVLSPELVMIDYPFVIPGLYSVPLAILDDTGVQVQMTVQLAPKDVGFDANPEQQ